MEIRKAIKTEDINISAKGLSDLFITEQLAYLVMIIYQVRSAVNASANFFHSWICVIIKQAYMYAVMVGLTRVK